MGYIYKITNTVNDKVYIGKTLQTIEQRWKAHVKDCKRRRLIEKRPLYNAMYKYGVDKFHITVVEKCNADVLSNREVYWISYYNSYKNGYNATLGGDGKQYIDTKPIIKYWNKGFSIKEIALKVKHDRGYISKILQNTFNINQQEIKNRSHSKTTISINQYTKEGKYIKTFLSVKDAESFCGIFNGKGGHIGSVCKYKRKTTYGYIWRYTSEEFPEGEDIQV